MSKLAEPETNGSVSLSVPWPDTPIPTHLNAPGRNFSLLHMWHQHPSAINRQVMFRPKTLENMCRLNWRPEPEHNGATHITLPNLSIPTPFPPFPLGRNLRNLDGHPYFSMVTHEFECKDSDNLRTLPAYSPATFPLTHTGTRATWRRRGTRQEPDPTQKYLESSAMWSTLCGSKKVSRSGQPPRQGLLRGK